MSNNEYLTSYVNIFIDSLVQSGVEDIVLCPGSRSTPLAYGFVKNNKIKLYRQIDERSAAYFALGLAKEKNKPVALLCTSGTAAANFFPAVVEASYARIPLVVITADRPHELREVGAPQAIDQIHLFGKHVKWSVDFPLPEDRMESLPFLERHVQRAVNTTKAAPKGPVHINVPFREPLLVNMQPHQPTISIEKTEVGNLTPSKEFLAWYQALLEKTDKGIIIAGDTFIPTEEFWEFAKNLKWPVLADPLSQLRSNIPEDCLFLCIDQYDALLKSDSFKGLIEPDAVIRFGAQPVSKPLMQFIQGIKPKVYIAVDESPLFRDPSHVVTHHVQVTPSCLWISSISKEDNPYLQGWRKANDIATKAVKSYLLTESDEGAMAGILFEQIKDGSNLFASSSMPIRDVDTFFLKTSKDIRIYANRGTNGIDGVVSSALGVQAASNRPTYLLIGDLAFLHDVNGLIFSRFHSTDLTIIVMNNDGGGIFSYLPQSTEQTYFEELFGTPTGLKFSSIAEMYGAQYDAVQSKEEFIQVLTQEKEKELRIIEVFTNRQSNIEAHRKLWDTIKKELDEEWSM